LNINIKINSHSYTTIMHIENTKLKYNQIIDTWKGLYQHPCKNYPLIVVLGWPLAMFFSSSTLSSLQEDFSI
jgi:hypothetical protein